MYEHNLDSFNILIIKHSFRHLKHVGHFGHLEHFHISNSSNISNIPHILIFLNTLGI